MRADGTPVVTLHDGALASTALVIPRLRNFMQAVANGRRRRSEGIPRVQLVIDPSLDYGVFYHMMWSLGAAGFDKFALVVRVGDGMKAIPFALPRKRLSSGLLPVVTMERNKLILWSLSGSAGTLRRPKLVTTRVDALARTLTAIAGRRWHGKRAPPRTA